MQTELQSLQNAANDLGLTIHHSFEADKRKKIPLYFAQKERATVSPKLPYNKMNMFLLGWRNALKSNK